MSAESGIAGVTVYLGECLVLTGAWMIQMLACCFIILMTKVWYCCGCISSLGTRCLLLTLSRPYDAYILDTVCVVRF